MKMKARCGFQQGSAFEEARGYEEVVHSTYVAMQKEAIDQTVPRESI